ncbi:hypothetical protein DASB73_023250 [Starmerella bacillaris]|uniref:Ankyrin n=1 Tax=Starmerella bacillaris TaxID=1247836 RepID=A0AAV5RK22_STABA|nr:hypothetical protein DASB73_023250 [Starmerella bacillaris]
MEGASFEERIIGAVRSNNNDILVELLADKSDEDKAKIINTTTDPVGRTLLHLASLYGNYDVLYSLLDQDNVEIDPLDRLEGNTPLHFAVKFSAGDEPVGKEVVNLLIECGADVNIKNKAGKKPIDIARASKLSEITFLLVGAQYASEMGAEAGADTVSGDVDGAADFGEDDEVEDGELSGEDEEEKA